MFNYIIKTLLKRKFEYQEARASPVVSGILISRTIPANTKHLYNIYTMLDKRRRRWTDIV